VAKGKPWTAEEMALIEQVVTWKTGRALKLFPGRTRDAVAQKLKLARAETWL
jgi:hypothetical protein